MPAVVSVAHVFNFSSTPDLLHAPHETNSLPSKANQTLASYFIHLIGIVRHSDRRHAVESLMISSDSRRK